MTIKEENNCVSFQVLGNVREYLLIFIVSIGHKIDGRWSTEMYILQFPL